MKPIPINHISYRVVVTMCTTSFNLNNIMFSRQNIVFGGGVRLVLKTNRDCFPKHHSHTVHCNLEALCFYLR
jgi:hypothetical protein